MRLMRKKVRHLIRWLSRMPLQRSIIHSMMELKPASQLGTAKHSMQKWRGRR